MLSQPRERHSDIVVVSHFFPARGGGIERVTGRLVDEYLRMGYRVAWFASESGAPAPQRTGLITFVVRGSHIVERLIQMPYPLWSPSILPQLWRSIGDSAAVHVHEHLYLGSISAIVIARLRGKKVVLTQHAGELRFAAWWLGALYATSARALAALVMRIASDVTFVSANVQRFFRDSISSRVKHVVVHNGVDASIFRLCSEHERSTLRDAMRLSMEHRVVLFAGRFVRKKGLGLLRELAARSPDLTWLFVGWGPEDPTSWNLQNVRVLGRLEQPELARVYAVSDALVLPSFGEGFPLVVQEALSCGTAVLSTEEVASACIQSSDLIHTETLRLDSSDAQRWLARLRLILEGEAGQATRFDRSTRAHALWSWDRCATTYVRLLKLMPVDEINDVARVR